MMVINITNRAATKICIALFFKNNSSIANDAPKSPEKINCLMFILTCTMRKAMKIARISTVKLIIKYTSIYIVFT